MDTWNHKTPAGYLFGRTYNSWHAEIKQRLRDIDITHPQFSVMASIEFLTKEKEFATQSEIAKNAGIDVMTVCGIIHTLERRKYLKKMPNPNDARASAVYLLNKGQIKLTEARAIVQAIDQLYFGRLGEEQDTFKRLLWMMLSTQSDDALK